MKENPFKYLRRKNGEAFGPVIVKNWYVARDYVLDKLAKECVYTPNDSRHLHVVVNGTAPLMLSVVRHLALYAHFVNFKEVDVYGELACRNRTVITVVCDDEKIDIVQELSKEEYLGNLLNYCKYTLYGKPFNENSYLDVEINIVASADNLHDDISFVCEPSEVEAFGSGQYDDVEQEDLIDTRKAVYASGMYKLGEVIDNIPAEDIHSARRYSMALDVYQYVQMDKSITSPLVDKSRWARKENLSAVKEGISNLFSSDCFVLRYNGMEECWREIQSKKKEERNSTFTTRRQLWEYYNELLSNSEHSRWVVEKLIMGYRPLNDSERCKSERLSARERKAYLKELKTRSTDPAHIDLCNSAELRRIDPDCRKYDSFIVLAIPVILDKVIG